MIAKGEWQDTNFVFTYINRDKMFQNLFLTDLSLSFLFLFIQLTDVRYFFILNVIHKASPPSLDSRHHLFPQKNDSWENCRPSREL